jgi:hypothetical protein
MTEHKDHNNKDYACVDKDAAPVDSDATIFMRFNHSLSLGVKYS